MQRRVLLFNISITVTTMIIRLLQLASRLWFRLGRSHLQPQLITPITWNARQHWHNHGAQVGSLYQKTSPAWRKYMRTTPKSFQSRPTLTSTVEILLAKTRREKQWDLTSQHPIYLPHKNHLWRSLWYHQRHPSHLNQPWSRRICMRIESNNERNLWCRQHQWKLPPKHTLCQLDFFAMIQSNKWTEHHKSLVACVH